MLKNKDHHYIGSEALDHLARMNVELLSEMWIMRDRMAVMEQLLVDKGLMREGEIDNFAPTKAFEDRLETLRTLMVENVIGAPYRHEMTVEQLKDRAKAFGTPKTE